VDGNNRGLTKSPPFYPRPLWGRVHTARGHGADLREKRHIVTTCVEEGGLAHERARTDKLSRHSCTTPTHGRATEMPSFFTDARLQKKAKQRKVAKYKLYSQHKKALRDEAAQSTTTGGVHHAITAEDSNGPQQQARKKKPKKFGAAASARHRWEKGQESVEAERQAALAAREQRKRDEAAARKRRSDQHVKLSKRTKRGQPVLSNQVELMLAKIQQGGA
jgi:hypothetical protein